MILKFKFNNNDNYNDNDNDNDNENSSNWKQKLSSSLTLRSFVRESFILRSLVIDDRARDQFKHIIVVSVPLYWIV